jgi:transcriptional repressor NrdR
MRCPNCGSHEIVVKDSREHKEYNWIKRRRECHYCEYRWNTLELAESELTMEEVEE